MVMTVTGRIWGANSAHAISLREWGSPHPRGTLQHQGLRMERFRDLCLCALSLAYCPFHCTPCGFSSPHPCYWDGRDYGGTRNLVLDIHVWEIFQHITGDVEKESRLETSIWEQAMQGCYLKLRPLIRRARRELCGKEQASKWRCLQ